MKKLIGLFAILLIVVSVAVTAMEIQPIQKTEKKQMTSMNTNVVSKVRQTDNTEKRSAIPTRKILQQKFQEVIPNKEDIPQPNVIYDMLETQIGRDKVILAGTDLGLYVYVVDGEVFYSPELNGLPTGDVFSIKQKENILVLGTEKGFFGMDLRSHNPVFENLAPYLKVYSLEMFEYEGVEYFVAGTSGGLWIVDVDNQELMYEVPVVMPDGRVVGEFYEVNYFTYDNDKDGIEERYLLFGMQYGAAGFKLEPDWQFNYLGSLLGDNYEYYGELAVYTLEPIYYGGDVYYAIGTSQGLYLRQMSNGHWSTAYPGEQIVDVYQSDALNKVIISTSNEVHTWNY